MTNCVETCRRVAPSARRSPILMTDLLQLARRAEPEVAVEPVRLDESELPHVFDRFFRGATARDRPGSGLGLAIVHQVAESHGGTLVARNAEGGGAELVLRLAAATDQAIRSSAIASKTWT